MSVLRSPAIRRSATFRERAVAGIERGERDRISAAGGDGVGWLGRSRPDRSLPLASRANLFLPHLAKFGRSFHQSLLSIFAVFLRCRSIPQRVDHVAGHAGSLFGAPAGFARFRRRSGTVQTIFHKVAKCLRAAERVALTGDPAIEPLEQVLRQPNGHRSLSRLRCGRLTGRHIGLRASNSGKT